ncbi:glycosyl hydrolase [Nocardia panacis]|uniref:Glycosyl hydrolase n=1 Tax=Nocardia panacis TaxID=2340916 RepID=A0A3A4JPG6_9NOCA|nr:glycosyl hydrolase [Nocardia panacis]RJO70908.1 glycosyl hydrolase [Nocardia panacis]
MRWFGGRAAAVCAVSAVVAALFVGANPGAARAMPVDRAGVLALLNGLPAQNRILSGQHNREPSATPFGWNWNTAPAASLYGPWTQKVADITGVRPAVWSGDLLYDAPFTDGTWRQALTDQAIAQWRAGSLVALTWHMCPPTTGSSCQWQPTNASDQTAVNGSLTDDQWQRLLTSGDPLNSALLSRFDEALPYLTQLRAAGVPVLLRPFHEMNDGWAWWGTTIGTSTRRQQSWRAALFRLMHDYYAGKGLDNLIWVWALKDVAGAQNRDATAEYPGDAYVDVLGLDLWWNRQAPADWYSDLHNVAPNKPMALTEVAQLPTAGTLAAQPLWAYAVAWAEYSNTDCQPITVGDGSSLCLGYTDPATGALVNYNTNQGTKDFYYRGNTLRQGQF